MIQDESEQSNESNAPKEPLSSENASAAGELSPLTDPDLRPVGRCFNELNRVRQLTQQARTVNAQLQDALTAFWVCRDAAKTVAGIAPANHYRGLYQASIFDSLADQVQQLESMIENFQ